MGGVAIVAIPEKDDYVWKISSEKVPHLTLLYLGDGVQNIEAIDNYLEHVAKTSMCRFGLSVWKRDVLGPENADVLLFSKHNRDMLLDVRMYLLQNEAVAKAYHNAEQFPTYIPHLTLGYPDFPANPDTREYGGINWVNFDKVALWYEDYEGSEYLLDDKYAIGEMMSKDNQSALIHYGIRGMRWGVRRAVRGNNGSSSTDHQTAAIARDKARKGGVKTLSNPELKALIERMNLERQYNSIVPPSKGGRFTRAGLKFVGDVMLNVGKQQATKLVNDQTAKLVAQAFRS